VNDEIHAPSVVSVYSTCRSPPGAYHCPHRLSSALHSEGSGGGVGSGEEVYSSVTVTDYLIVTATDFRSKAAVTLRFPSPITTNVLYFEMGRPTVWQIQLREILIYGACVCMNIIVCLVDLLRIPMDESKYEYYRMLSVFSVMINIGKLPLCIYFVVYFTPSHSLSRDYIHINIICDCRKPGCHANL